MHDATANNVLRKIMSTINNLLVIAARRTPIFEVEGSS